MCRAGRRAGFEIREPWPEARRAQRGRSAPRPDATRSLKGRSEHGETRSAVRSAKGGAPCNGIGRRPEPSRGAHSVDRPGRAYIVALPCESEGSNLLHAPRSQRSSKPNFGAQLAAGGAGAPAASCGPSLPSEAAVSAVGIGESRAVGRGLRFSSGGLILFRNTAWLPRGGPPLGSLSGRAGKGGKGGLCRAAECSSHQGRKGPSRKGRAGKDPPFKGRPLLGRGVLVSPQKEVVQGGGRVNLKRSAFVVAGAAQRLPKKQAPGVVKYAGLRVGLDFTEVLFISECCLHPG